MTARTTYACDVCLAVNDHAWYDVSFDYEDGSHATLRFTPTNGSALKHLCGECVSSIARLLLARNKLARHTHTDA